MSDRETQKTLVIEDKPRPLDFDDYEDFIEALVRWKVDQLLPGMAHTPVNHNLDDFETHEAHLNALIDGVLDPHTKELKDRTRRTDAALRKAIATKDPADWIAFRNLLDEWVAAGIHPVAFPLGKDKTIWLFDRVGDGIAAHQEDGTVSWYWSEESGAQVWPQENIPQQGELKCH